MGDCDTTPELPRYSPRLALIGTNKDDELLDVYLRGEVTEAADV